jgi:septal ring factor EnvC (AmiA/AmiB activator)
MPNPIIKLKRGSGQPVNLQGSEPAFDTLNKVLYIGTSEGVLPIGGEGVFAKKTFVNSAVEAEADLRSAADSTLTTNLNAEISRAQGAESDLADDIAAETSARQSAISGAVSTLEAADTALDGKISTEKGRIDAILSASSADKDSFAEIVTLINSVDLTNDNALAAAILSINDSIADETSARTSGDSSLQGNIDTVSSDLSALTTRVSAAEQDILDEESARIAAVSAEAAARASDVSGLEADIALVQSNLDSESSTRSTADTSLSNRITTLENASADSRLDAVEADVADHETRISALESTIDGGTY